MRSLVEFVRAAWPHVEGARPLAWNWHLDAVCDHLQALSEDRLGTRKLAVNIPPRCSKSTLVTIMFPCWLWIRQPHLQFMFASYSFGLSRDHAYKRRAILESEWFQRCWGHRVKLAGDRNNIMEIANDSRGLMYTTSVGGTVTGRGGDWLLLDDPNSVEEMESEVQRASVLRWLDVNWATRANDANTVREVVIQQRTHTEDVTGHVLRQGGWSHLKIAMEFAPERRCATPIWTDPRKSKGELIDPTRFPKAYVDGQRLRLGPYAFAGQYDQEPYPLGGGIIKASWLNRWKPSDRQPGYISFAGGSYEIDPWKCLRFATVDLAMTEKTIGAKKTNDPDWTVMAAWAVLPTPQGPHLILLDLIRDRMEGPDSLDRLAGFERMWKFAFEAVEDISEKSWYQLARRRCLRVREISTGKGDDVIYTIDKDKVSRAMAATPLMASGRFHIPDYAPWLSEFIAELVSFPNAGHDDQVDVVSAACAIAEKCAGVGIEEANRTTSSPRGVYPDVNRQSDQPINAVTGFYLDGMPPM